MSYRPNYSDSWRPPGRENWRPSERSDFEVDRRWNGTRIKYDEDGRPVSQRPLPSVGGDYWRPQIQENHSQPSRPREGDRHGSENSLGRASYHELSLQRPEFSARTNLPDTVQSRSSLKPSTPAFQPGVVPESSSFKDAIPASLRSAKSSNNSSNKSTGRKGGDNLAVTAQQPAPSQRYSLRSRQPAISPLNASNDTSHSLGYLNQTNNQPDPGVLSTLQSKYGETRSPSHVSPPPAPSATGIYLAQARLPVIRFSAPKKLLVILDLNGTLLVRPNRKRPRDYRSRPGVPQLLDYLFGNHVVMVYSSAQLANVRAMVDTLVDEKRARALAAIWGRDKLDLTPAQYKEKVQVYKKLDKVWHDESIQATCPDGQRWSQANTVLVDDSHLKALSQPHNLIQVPVFEKFQQLTKEENRRELGIIASLRAMLEELKWSTDVSRHILRWQTGEMKPPRADKLRPLQPPKGVGEMGSDSIGAELGQDDSASIDDQVVIGGVSISSRSSSSNSSDRDDVQTALGREMKNLSTEDPRALAAEEIERLNLQPAISEAEWKDFLK